ncbi:sensor domain-containing diguanylate cyclase [Oceanispirochaeta sp.]|jgi:diguanylate cyclase (GGDEF)-like protein|uniref:sensor domain-containing diguanylate cyclase n=1 Tax=Oceanispirochaeta sp. TaxID=2035350 RepID=UPI002634D7A3|nr:sensor domain-containing diguanylate cyclase [Oceanispirochaeta sp.]MDA3957512.1 sensor domain-containing diguanylate cyclase [Oceanispirochaeta sp.]
MHVPSKRFTQSILITIIAVSFIGISLFSYYSARSSMRKEILHSSLPLLSENIYSNIQSNLSLPINISSAISRDTFLINWINKGESNEKEITDYLSTIREEYGFLTTFFVSEKTGNYYYFDGLLKKISLVDPHDVWYYRFVDSGLKYDLDVDSDEASNGLLSVFVNFRVEDSDGRFLGIAGVGVRLDQISATLAEKRDLYNRDIYMVDDTGVIQVHSDLSKVETVSIYDIPGLQDVADKLLTPSEQAIDLIYNSQPDPTLISSRYMEELGWFVLVEQKEHEYLGAARRNLILTILVGILTTLLLSFLSSRTISSFQVYLENLASTDSLTGALNRRELEKRFTNGIYSMKRYGSSYSLIIIDLDDFKRVNDEYGHTTGDNLLIKMTDVIHEMIRPTDVLARWGGDEFVILLDTDSGIALNLADRIREALSEDEIVRALGVSNSMTVSMGVTPVLSDDSLKAAVLRADAGLYESKNTGKNKVVIKS